MRTGEIVDNKMDAQTEEALLAEQCTPAGLVKCDKCGWSHAPDDACVPDNSLSARYEKARIALCEKLPDPLIDGYLAVVGDCFADYRNRLEAAEKLICDMKDLLCPAWRNP